ncbi:MAG: hypothetical protein ACSHXY_03635 [Alphaproteobacteria bacterium]
MTAKFLKFLPMIAVLGGLSACVHEDSTSQTPMPEVTHLEWQEAVNLIYEGNVGIVMQTHKGEVSFTLKNGDRYVTQSPTMDEILRVKKGCGAPCADMAIAME